MRERILQAFLTALLAAALVLVSGMAYTGATGGSPSHLQSLQTPPAEAASRHTMKVVRDRARRVARKWCRINNMNARIPVAPGVTRRVKVSRCTSRGLVKNSCWWQARYRRGECGIYVYVLMEYPWHGRPGFDLPILRRCYDSAILVRELHTRVIKARQELEATCYEDLDASLRA